MNVKKAFLCSLMLAPALGVNTVFALPMQAATAQQQQGNIRVSGTVVDAENNTLATSTSQYLTRAAICSSTTLVSSPKR